jgi:ATP-dependent Clp protease ATP-binding subunit ClpB
VRTDVLFPLAQKLLKGTIRDGDVVKIHVADGKIEIKDNHPPDPTLANPVSEVNVVNPEANAPAEETLDEKKY